MSTYENLKANYPEVLVENEFKQGHIAMSYLKFSKELEFWRNEKKSITKSNFLSNCLKSFKYLMAINLVQGNFFLRKSAQYEIPGSVIKIIAGEKGKFRLSTNL